LLRPPATAAWARPHGLHSPDEPPRSLGSTSDKLASRPSIRALGFGKSSRDRPPSQLTGPRETSLSILVRPSFERQAWREQARRSKHALHPKSSSLGRLLYHIL